MDAEALEIDLGEGVAGQASLPALGVLREASFRWLLGAQSASSIGDYMVLAALPFAVFALGGSAGEVGVAFGVEALAFLALIPLGGAIGDRLRRRSLMIGADLARFAAVGIFATLMVSGQAELWQLLVVQLVHGACSALFLPASSALVPETVHAARLQEANALRGLCTSSTAMVGPALAGIALDAVGPGFVFALDAASFLISAALLAMVRSSSKPVAGGSILGELAEGWSQFRRRTWLWAVVAQFALLNALVFAPFYVFGAGVAAHSLGGPAAWAAILTATGVGELAGSVVALSWKPEQPLLVATAAIASWASPALLLATLAPLAAIVAAAGPGRGRPGPLHRPLANHAAEPCA